MRHDSRWGGGFPRRGDGLALDVHPAQRVDSHGRDVAAHHALRHRAATGNVRGQCQKTISVKLV